MTTELKQRFEQVFLEAVNILRDDAPKDTDNLAYNAIKYKWVNDNEFVIYVDMYKTQIKSIGASQPRYKRANVLKKLFVISSRSMRFFGFGSLDRFFKISIKNIKSLFKAKQPKNKAVKQAKGKSKKADGIAPYMPYTNEPWLSPRWNGKQNPNEGWWNDSIEFIVQYIGKRLGGEFV